MPTADSMSTATMRDTPCSCIVTPISCSAISIAVINLTTGESGLSLSPPRSAFADDAEIEAISAEIGAARISAAAAAERFSDHAALIADRLARLIAIAGSHPVETQLPTGADAEDPDTPVHPDTEYELGMGAVEEKLRALATRLNGDGAKDTGGADT